MALKVGYLIFAVLASSCFRPAKAQCSVNIRTDLAAKDPLYLTKSGELWVPEGPALEWKKGESTVVACSGPKNSLVPAKSSGSSITCNKGDTFKVDNKNIKSADLECSTSISGDVQITDESCSNGGTIQHIGFETNLPDIGFVKYIDVCYNSKIASVVYTRHVIRGAAIKFAVSQSIRPSFKLIGIPKTVKPAVSYQQKYQTTRLTELVGKKMAAKYINSTSFLARGHLAPDNDGTFKTWQYATYFYINVAPEWQIVNAGNWLRVENIARATAGKLLSNLEVFTGVSGILSLPNDSGKLVPITLEDDGKLVVPKFYWKVLKYDTAAIAFVTMNNPFATEEEVICKDICDDYGWSNPAFSDFTKGYTYCCDVNELSKKIPDVPKEAGAKSILKNK